MKNDFVVVAVSGKKQSGKSTLCSYLQNKLYFDSMGYTKAFKQNASGEIIYLNKGFKPLSLDEYKIYSFADPLKRFLIDVLGVPEECCYGTDDQKNQPTEYNWEDLPSEIRYLNSSWPDRMCVNEKSGKMTARELMACFGTDIIKKYFGEEIWVKATVRSILNNTKAKCVFISDLRFISEVEYLRDNLNTFFIRLNKKFSDDSHRSEVELDNYKWDLNRSIVIDNSDLDINEKNRIALEFINKIIRSK